MLLHLEQIWSCCGQRWKTPKKQWKMGPKWDFSWPHRHAIDSFEKKMTPPSQLDFFQHAMRHIMCYEICFYCTRMGKGWFLRLSQRDSLENGVFPGITWGTIDFSNLIDASWKLDFFPAHSEIFANLGCLAGAPGHCKGDSRNWGNLETFILLWKNGVFERGCLRTETTQLFSLCYFIWGRYTLIGPTWLSAF